ncbi:ABC transporter substrate-binding protein [Dactylosporangium sp. NPDC000521]|uniref:ABC transporter substrate-binding protein n=1 Tax=Dactylosporangium sp. NPDC000521 TaxID=3363975 RepID=UPI0036A177D2
MVKRSGITAVVAAALAVLAAGCSNNDGAPGDGTSKSRPIAKLTLGSTPVSTLDYTKNNAGYGSGVGSLALEPLLVLGTDGKIKPWLAESWSQPDATTYVYQLRKGVKFTDGNELKASDAAFSLNYYRQPGSTNAYNFPPTLTSITATEPYTLTIKFSEPNAAWASAPTRASMGIFGQSHFEAHKATFGNPGTAVVGTGPWKVDSFSPTAGAELSKNTTYWGGPVNIERIAVKFFSNETSQAIAFRAHEIDMAFPFDNRSFASTAGTKILTAPGPGDQGNFSMNVLQAPWDDVHVRRAVAYALDKESLIKAYGGYAKPLDTLISAGLLAQLGSKNDVDATLAKVTDYPFDLGKAKAEMAQSKYPNGADATLSVSDSGQTFATTSQAIAAQLKEIGIRVKLDVQTSQANSAEVTGADRKAIRAGFSVWGAVSADPGEAFDYSIGSANATQGNWNATNWGTPQSDALIADGKRESDPSKRLAIYGDLLQDFAVDVPFVPLFLIDATAALSPEFAWSHFDGFWRFRGPWALEIGKAA